MLFKFAGFRAWCAFVRRILVQIYLFIKESLDPKHCSPQSLSFFVSQHRFQQAAAAEVEPSTGPVGQQLLEPQRVVGAKRQQPDQSGLPSKILKLDKHKKPQTVGSAEMLRSAAAPAAYTGQGKPGQWAPTSTLVSVWPVQPVVPGTQGCGSAFISCESGSSFFFYTDSDAGPFSMRKRIQLEKLCQKIPCEKFAVVKNSAGHLRHS